MSKLSVSYESTGKFSKLILDYNKFPEKFGDFIEGEVIIENFEKKLKDISFSDEKRKLLVNAVHEQYNSLGVDSNTNIDRLLDESTYTITTGHQLCLFGGPQYFISKIVSTIKLCDQVKEKYPWYEFIPVFWLASEDHDFEEINTVKLFGKELKTDQIGKGPVGRLKASIFENQLVELKEILGESDAAKKLLTIFENAYNSDLTLSEATRLWVGELFKEFDLVIVDGDDPELKASFAPLMKEELVNRKSYTVIETTSNELVNLGYQKQVSPREINLFYIEDGIRERFVFEDGKYKVLNTDKEFSETEIFALLDQHPEKFSPNAVFRPLYQEDILPNIGYVGGPGELAYWLQLKDNFDRINVSFPLLILRDSFISVQSKQYKQFIDFGFKFEDIFKHEDDLIKQFVKEKSKEELHFEFEDKLLRELHTTLVDKVSKVDHSLSGMVNAEMKGIENLFAKLEKRLIKAQKHKEEVNINKIRKIKHSVMPNGTMKERSESFIPGYLKSGSDYINSLIDRSDVFEKEVKIMSM